MAHHQASNVADVEECKRVKMRTEETRICFIKMYIFIKLGYVADKSLIDYSKYILSPSSVLRGDKLARIKLLSENIIAERDAKLQIVDEMKQIDNESDESYQKIFEMDKPRDMIHFGNAYIANIEKVLDMRLPFAKKVIPLYDKYSTEMKRLLSIPPSVENGILSRICAEISKLCSQLEVEHRNLDRTPFVRKSLQGKSDSAARVATAEKDRLEDVFTDISSRFASAQEFEKFAFAGTGLSLNFVEVDEIKSDNTRELERRVAMVRLWSQKEGKRGTPTNLRKLADQYFESQIST